MCSLHSFSHKKPPLLGLVTQALCSKVSLKLIFKNLLAFMFILSLSACNTVGIIGYLDDHPDFSPIVSREGKTEIQVSWYRSWKPMIYLKAHIEQDEYEEIKRAYVSYSITKSKITSLKKQEISIEAWESIIQAYNDSKIWSYESKCDELSYKNRSLYFENNGSCEEVIMMDGAKISIAISEPNRNIGILRVCNDLKLCEPLGSIPFVMLKAIGKEKTAI